MGASYLLRDLDAILERGAKQTTYKFAVLRAIAEWIIEHPLAQGHRIPVGWLAYRILPWFVHQETFPVPHHHKPDKTVIEVCALEIASAAGGAIPFEVAWLNGRIPVTRALHDIRRTLIQQPLDKLRNLDGRQLDFYELRGVTRSTGLHHRLRPEPHHAKSLAEFITGDPCVVVLDAETTRAITPLRFMIRDVCIQRWATWSETKSKQRGIRPYILTALGDPNPSRLSTQPFRDTFRKLGLTDRCVLSGRKIRKLDIDHLIPWSLFPRHDFTNLIPSEREINQHVKRDHIPVVTLPFERRLRAHFDALLDGHDAWFRQNPAPFDSSSEIVASIRKTTKGLAEITGRPSFAPTR